MDTHIVNMSEIDQFMWACRYGNLKTAKELHRKDNRVATLSNSYRNSYNGLYVNSYGETGLMWSLTNNHHSLVRWLLSLPDCAVSHVNKYRGTILHIIACHSLPIPSDIMTAIFSKHSEIVQIVNVVDSFGKTALNMAIDTNNEEATVNLLSVAGIDLGESREKVEELSR